MDTICQAHVAEAIIGQTGVLRGMSFYTSRPVDLSGAVEINDCRFFATDAYKQDIQARDEVARSAVMARLMEIDRLCDLGFVLRSDLSDEDAA